MTHTEKWEIDIFVDEHEGRTRAEARLRTRDDTHLKGVGYAVRNPKDPDVPEIGAVELLHFASTNVEGKPVDCTQQCAGPTDR